MLTPSAKDPNRKAELKRKRENPLDFGNPDGPYRPEAGQRPGGAPNQKPAK